MKKLQNQIISAISIIWCITVIIDQLLGNELGLSFINEDWASMTIITSSLFILLFSTRIISKYKVRLTFITLLGILSIIIFISGLFVDDRTYISSLATTFMFFLLSIHGYYFEKKEKLYLRFVLKLIVYTTSNLVLIIYFLYPDKLYSIPGFESVSWNTAVGFLLYSSTMLSNYYGNLLENSDLPEDFSILNKSIVDFWFRISFYSPVIIILLISLLHFFDILSTKTGMGMSLFFICLLPFPLTYFIYRETINWSIQLYKKNTKLFLREQDVHFHNQLLQEFAQITSHNLRGPIIGLSNITKLALESDTSDDIKERTFFLLNEKLPSLVNTVESLAEFYNMIRSGKIEFEECDVKKFFEEVLTDSKNNYDVDTLNLEVKFDLGIKTIEYPEIYFKNLLYNLVSNAIKYRKKSESLFLQISTRDLGLDGIELKFRDNGMGMNLKYFKKKIFKFGSSYHNLKNSQGIGLFIVKNQLARLGDTIDVNSEEGNFTEFIIKLNHNGKKELGYS